MATPAYPPYAGDAAAAPYAPEGYPPAQPAQPLAVDPTPSTPSATSTAPAAAAAAAAGGGADASTTAPEATGAEATSPPPTATATGATTPAAQPESEADKLRRQMTEAQVARTHCRVCRKGIAFGESVRLSCFHTLCLGCAKAQAASAGQLKCPACGAVEPNIADADAVETARKRDLLLELQLAHEYRQQQQREFAAAAEAAGADGTASPARLRCGGCDEDVDDADARPAFTCDECEMFLCEEHARLHGRKATTKNHALTPYKDSAVWLTMCGKHRGALDGYCVTCDELVCATCVAEAHPRPLHNAAQATAEQRDRLLAEYAKACAAARQGQTQVLDAVVQARANEAQLAQRVATLRAEISAAFEEARRALAAREQALYQQVDAFRTQQRDRQAEAQAALQARWAALQAPLALSSELTSADVQPVYAVAVAHPATARLNAVLVKSPPAVPPLQTLSFVPPSAGVLGALTTAGQLVPGDVGTVARRAKG